MLRKTCVALALAVFAVAAPAQWQGWEADFDDKTKPWKEIQAKIPPYPKPENLLLVDVGGVSAHRFYVDANSVALGEDEVMRYTVVIKAAGGATNVSFEGMRCRTRERKMYALGRSDGTWVRARDSAWQRIVPRDLAPYRFVLYREYFCPTPSRPPSAQQAVDALRRGYVAPPAES